MRKMNVVRLPFFKLTVVPVIWIKRGFWICILALVLHGSSQAQKPADENLIPDNGPLISCSNWVEFKSAVADAQPGDVIQLKNGTYAGNIQFSKSGTPGKPVTIIPENPGKVIINGDSEWIINGKYITIDGFYFLRGSSTHPVQFSLRSSHSRFINGAIVGWNLGGGDTRLITVRGTHNEVAHCVLREKDTSGMMLEVVRESSRRNDHRIHDVYFGYFKDPGSGNGYETVRVSTSGHSLSGSHTILEHSLFEQCNGESEIISNKSGHNIYRNNTFLNSDGALTLRHGRNALIEGNVFINTLNRKSSRCNGVRVIGEHQIIRNNYFLNLPEGAEAIRVQYGNQNPHRLTQYDPVKDVLLENNTLYNCDRGIVLGANRRPHDDPPRIMPPFGTMRNNLIISDKGRGLSLEMASEVLSDKLFILADNIIAEKAKTDPGTAALPAGVSYIPLMKMEEAPDGLYWPASGGLNAGVQHKMHPLSVMDVAPDWVKAKIKAGNPDFTGNPWK